MKEAPPAGALVIRRSIHIAAAPGRVWKEFESFERFSAWFGVLVDEFDRNGVRRAMGHRVLEYTPEAGGWVEMEVQADGGEVRRFGGKVLLYDPPRELTFEDAWLPNDTGEPPLLLTFLLTPVKDGTMVELLQHGFERLGERGPETHRGHEGGWTLRQLEALRRIVEGA